MAEYLLLCAVVAAVFGLGLGFGMPNGMVGRWMHALSGFFQRFVFALSLPT
jgi:hypothetical protein